MRCRVRALAIWVVLEKAGPHRSAPCRACYQRPHTVSRLGPHFMGGALSLLPWPRLGAGWGIKSRPAPPRPFVSAGCVTQRSPREPMATYTVTYSLAYRTSHALAKAAGFDSRQTVIEMVLGMSSSAAVNIDKQPPLLP